MKTSVKQIQLPAQVVNHFYVGVLITLFYILLSPKVIAAGFPGMAILLLAELVILAPLVTGHLFWSARKQRLSFSGPELIPFQQRISFKKFLLWTAGGLIACVVVYVPLYPVGLYFRETIFSWLPAWYFDPTYGPDDLQVIANVFLVGIFVDGLVGPVAEEFFFRGYLLPRMAYLKKWAPIVNGVLFGLYHFWQPHNLIALMAIGIVLSYVVWKTKNVYVGIAIHCTLNLLGALGGYLAVLDGTLISR